MNLYELKEVVDGLVEQAERQRLDANSVSVSIKSYMLGTVGPTSTTDIATINMGFDWDKGRVIINPTKTLREIDRDEVKSIRDRFEKEGWTQYSVRNLKAEHNKLKKLYSELLDNI